jgi:hypothetical protein
VSPFSAAVLFSGVVLEVCLAASLLWDGRWRRYPWFSLCVAWFVARTFALFRFPPSQYPNFYWTTDAADVLIRFLVVWEFARRMFSRTSLVKVFFSRSFVVVVAALLTFGVSTVWSYQTYARSHSVRTAMERSSSFTQAFLTLGLLLAARYYAVPLGRQLWAIALAFGAWASLTTLNNAMIDLEHAFLPYWQIVRPLSFVALVGAWTWALWREAPDYDVAKYPLQQSDLSIWTEQWNQTQSAIRRAKSS